MKINIYTKLNGVGLEADAHLLYDILSPFHDVSVIDWDKPTRRPANIGIHLEHIRKELINLCRYNISVPNPEWFDDAFKPLLRNINLVLCKTLYTKQIFDNLHPNCVYTSFTSRDMYVSDYEKCKMFLHLAGKSSHKGTETVYNAWKNDLDMPILFMQKSVNVGGFRLNQKNYVGSFKRVKFDEISEMLNMSLFHLCPSKAEGFGHYINEALSCGAIVISTDAPPMNELIKPDYGFLIPAHICGKHRLSDEFCVSLTALKETIKRVMAIDNDTLLEMSQKARESYLQRDKFFKETLLKTINDIA